MTKKPTDLDDIAEAISSLATLMDKRFEQVDKRFEQVDKRFEQVDQQFHEMRRELRTMNQQHNEMREWLIKIDSRLSGVESDIVEIYDRIVVLKSKKGKLSSDEQQEVAHKITALIKWTRRASRQLGIPEPKLG